MEERDGEGDSKQSSSKEDRSHGGDGDGDDDWLESEDKTTAHNEMGERDSKKVHRKLYDEGYRAGITKGKESMVQIGFDSAYNEKGAPLGRKYGHLLGQITALSQYAQKRHSGRSEEVDFLLRTVRAIKAEDLAEPDWEALEHERVHNADTSEIHRETIRARQDREEKLDNLQKRVDELAQVTISGSQE